ncbi:hypothetical protein TGFOU_403880 [Toxoplasma gondii FOU]|uniref:Uncharacterized protein n=1 Tax=Toxoplasma gondii FOU TaxID=943167 RepID=A0A086L9A9_TOXGO|nr:hypothetical protein TGFOU_403880 [Toxoplasma gondii FOU]
MRLHLSNAAGSNASAKSLSSLLRCDTGESFLLTPVGASESLLSPKPRRNGGVSLPIRLEKRASPEIYLDLTKTKERANKPPRHCKASQLRAARAQTPPTRAEPGERRSTLLGVAGGTRGYTGCTYTRLRRQPSAKRTQEETGKAESIQKQKKQTKRKTETGESGERAKNGERGEKGRHRADGVAS